MKQIVTAAIIALVATPSFAGECVYVNANDDFIDLNSAEGVVVNLADGTTIQCDPAPGDFEDEVVPVTCPGYHKGDLFKVASMPGGNKDAVIFNGTIWYGDELC